MNDKIKINLQMAGAAYPLTINREDEEIVREAAKQVYLYLIVHTSSFFYSFNKAMHLSTSRTNLDNRSFVSFTSLPLRLIVVAVFRFV